MPNERLTPAQFVKLFRKLGTKSAVCKSIGQDESNFYKWYKRHKAEINRLLQEGTGAQAPAPVVSQPEPEPVDITGTILRAMNKGITINGISELLKVSSRVAEAYIADISDQGYNVDEANGLFTLRKDIELESNIYKNDWKGDKIIRFGLCGDNQENSKYTQITHLQSFYDLLVYEGIEKCYHTGDIDEGEDMRQGHKYECYDQGADNHVANIVRNYPKRDSIATDFITGNHDWSILKKVGYDIGIAIAAKRPDMKYLGQGNALISLTPNCTLELRHPGDGTAYAISYKSQKMIEAMSGGEKPNILAIGHYHKAEYIFYRNIHCIQTGCFQAQTPWMVGKSIAAMVGGWIIEVHVNDEGTITRFKNEFVPYYKTIKEDYKNWL